MSDKQPLGFDLEIAKEIPDHGDWREVAPLGITCAALGNSKHTEIWSTQGDQMDVEQCRDLAKYIIRASVEGYPIVTWNGMGFDFPVLAQECKDPDITDALIAVALEHYDIGFQMVCAKGYMIGLDKAAKALGLPGKPEGMHGDLAPILWKQGPDAREKVVSYLVQDVVTTADVYQTLTTDGELRWISQRGYPQTWNLGIRGLLSVRSALDIPAPRWVAPGGGGRGFVPWSRTKYLDWTGITLL